MERRGQADFQPGGRDPVDAGLALVAFAIAAALMAASTLALLRVSKPRVVQRLKRGATGSRQSVNLPRDEVLKAPEAAVMNATSFQVGHGVQ